MAVAPRVLLAAFPSARSLHPDDLKVLLNALEPVRLPAGSVLFAAGEPPEDGYLVVAGTVRVVRPGEGELILGTLGRGQLIGEMGLLDGAPRSATVLAETDVTGLRLRREQWAELRGSGHPAAFWFLEEVGRRLGERMRRMAARQVAGLPPDEPHQPTWRQRALARLPRPWGAQ